MYSETVVTNTPGRTYHFMGLAAQCLTAHHPDPGQTL
jgi:hypothetical protein